MRERTLVVSATAVLDVSIAIEPLDPLALKVTVYELGVVPPPPPSPLGVGIVLVVVVVVGVEGAAGLLGGDIGIMVSSLGVTTLEDLEFELLPTLLSATTVNSYRTPSVNPEIAHLAPIVMQVIFRGCDVTTYLLIGDPPFDFGADHFTTARALPAVACTERTAVGTEIFEAAEAGKEKANERTKALPATKTALFQRAVASVLKSLFTIVSLEVICCSPELLNKFHSNLREHRRSLRRLSTRIDVSPGSSRFDHSVNGSYEHCGSSDSIRPHTRDNSLATWRCRVRSFALCRGGRTTNYAFAIWKLQQRTEKLCPA